MDSKQRLETDVDSSTEHGPHSVVKKNRRCNYATRPFPPLFVFFLLLLLVVVVVVMVVVVMVVVVVVVVVFFSLH